MSEGSYGASLMTPDTRGRLALIRRIRDNRGGTWLECLGTYLTEAEPLHPETTLADLVTTAKAVLASRQIELKGHPTLVDWVLCLMCVSLLSTEGPQT
jgi:hypothetical protein